MSSEAPSRLGRLSCVVPIWILLLVIASCSNRESLLKEEIDKGNPSACIELSDLYRHKGDEEVAIALLGTAVKLGSQEAMQRLQQGEWRDKGSLYVTLADLYRDYGNEKKWVEYSFESLPYRRVKGASLEVACAYLYSANFTNETLALRHERALKSLLEAGGYSPFRGAYWLLLQLWSDGTLPKPTERICEVYRQKSEAVTSVDLEVLANYLRIYKYPELDKYRTKLQELLSGHTQTHNQQRPTERSSH
jgi:hypothetical protein